MNNRSNDKHRQSFPKPRGIRRACSKELYRTIKRLGEWIPEEKAKEAETLYYKKVILNLPFVVENGQNRKKLSDWWEEEVCPEIASLWGVRPDKLAEAFRDAFGG
jgi:hypothetical protein